MSIPAFVRGSIAPTFTAFHDDLSLDDDGQRNLLDYMVQAGGVNAFFLRSGMGQMFAFGYDEVQQLTRNVCKHLAGRAPVLIGCNGIWDRNYDRRPDPAVFLRECVELGKFAADQGADGVVYTVPEALLPAPGESTADVTVRFFETLCAAVAAPVFLYQPPKTLPEYMLSPETWRTLAGIDNLVGGKASQSDGEYVFRICRAVQDRDFAMIIGCETVFYAGVMAGGRAAIGQGTSLNPWVINAIQDRWDAGDIAGVIQAQEVTNLLCDTCPNPVEFLKRYATDQGFRVPLNFRPMTTNPYMQDPTPMSEAQYTAFKAIFEREAAPYR